MILPYFSRKFNLHQDIVNVIVLYSRKNTVYSTINSEYSGHPEAFVKKDVAEGEYGFKEIELFENKNINIVKLDMNETNAFFLDDTGTVWTCGDSDGSGIKYIDEWDCIHIPREITYFVKENQKSKTFNVDLLIQWH